MALIGNGRGGGGSSRETAVEESGKEVAGRVARFSRPANKVGGTYLCYVRLRTAIIAAVAASKCS